MKIALDDQGIQLGVFKISRLMREAGIIAKVPKNPTITHQVNTGCTTYTTGIIECHKNTATKYI